MTHSQEKLLIAALAGLVIAAAAAFVVSPSLAGAHAAAPEVHVSAISPLDMSRF